MACARIESVSESDEFKIDSEARIVTPVSAKGNVESMRVPALFGEILSAERRGKYILVMTESGRVSYHACSPRHHHDKLAGKMHWHSIRKALRNHCLLPQLKTRVNFHITHTPYAGGGLSAVGAGGRVTVDKQTVLQCSAYAHGLRPDQLGAALADYLFLDPGDAMRSDNLVTAAVALLDRRTSLVAVQRAESDRFSDEIWTAFYGLRLSLVS